MPTSLSPSNGLPTFFELRRRFYDPFRVVFAHHRKSLWCKSHLKCDLSYITENAEYKRTRQSERVCGSTRDVNDLKGKAHEQTKLPHWMYTSDGHAKPLPTYRQKKTAREWHFHELRKMIPDGGKALVSRPPLLSGWGSHASLLNEFSICVGHCFINQVTW